MSAIDVVVFPAPNAGWFEVFYAGKRLCITQYPLRDVGRGFLARGYKPEAVITFQHSFPWPAFATTLGKAARNSETFENHNVVKFKVGSSR